MKVALPVIKLGQSQNDNLRKVICNIKEAADNGSEFIFFAETTISGLIPNDNASEMLPLGQEIPGGITSEISSACKNNNIWVSIGLLEREKNKLFDIAVIINPNGKIKLKYRRISPHWHWSKSDPNVFCQGSSAEYIDTSFGRISTLICGDFFDEEGQLHKIKTLKPDFLHLLLVRSGDKGNEYNQEKWEKEEIPEYSSQVRKLSIPVFMVNYIDEECFGGATIFASDGSVISSLPLWQEGILHCEM